MVIIVVRSPLALRAREKVARVTREIILVDTYEQERIQIQTGKIYLITMPDGSSAIKRLALSEHANRFKLICISDNLGVYRPFEFELDPGKSIKHYVLGRVRWAGKEFD
ncbi:MAG: S24/S26 family peptidase [Syntrophobacteraceae bacterium]